MVEYISKASLHPAKLLTSKLGLLSITAICGITLLSATLLSQQAQYVGAAAGDGVSSNIRLLDTNGNGKIDRITLDVANVNGENWSLTGASPHGFSVTQAGNDITISSVSITSAANATPVTVQIDLNEADGDLTVNTSNNNTELIYTQGNTGTNCVAQACLTDDTDEELNAISTGDSDTTDTEGDYANPIPTSGIFNDGNNDARIEGLTIQWSESISLAAFSASDFEMGNAGDLIWDTPTGWSSEGSQMNFTVSGPVNVTGTSGIATWKFIGSNKINGSTGGTAQAMSTALNLADNAKPQIIGVSPTHNSTINGATEITVQFTEGINTGTFAITNSGGGALGTPNWSSSDSRLTITGSTLANGAQNITVTTADDNPTNSLGTLFATNPWTYTVDNTVSINQGGSSTRLRQEQQTTDNTTDTDSNNTTNDDSTGSDDTTTDDTNSNTPTDDPNDESNPNQEQERKEFGQDENGEPLLKNALVMVDGSNAVYHIDANGVRHAFTHLSVYRSWFGDDFSKVVRVSSSTIASLPLGDPVTYRPGTMIKIPSVNRVYLIVGNRQMRHIDNETVAKAIFGDDWNKMIYDVSEAFFLLYEDLDNPIISASEVNLEELATLFSDLDQEIRS